MIGFAVISYKATATDTTNANTDCTASRKPFGKHSTLFLDDACICTSADRMDYMYRYGVCPEE